MNIEEIIENLNGIIYVQPTSHIGCIAELSKNLLKHQASLIESQQKTIKELEEYKCKYEELCK